jgi:MoaA/NifB/PqqE/SkfB family radical SAM enzyme
MYKVTSIYPHQDKTKIEWNLGKRCNYDCSYCPSEIHDNSSPHTDINILKNTVNQLSKLNNPRLSFTGGEPTVHPLFEELIEYARPVIQWISVTTNGTRKADYYISLPVDHYVFSLHFEYDWERVLETILSVAKTGRKIMVNVMAHHDKMDSVRHVANILSERNIMHGIRRIRWGEFDRDDFDDNKYTTEDIEWLLSCESTVEPNTIIDDDNSQVYHANDIIKLHLNQYKGWTCNAGIESLMINHNGDVFRATCRVGGSLGNIYHGSFFQNPAPVICTRNNCTCAADIPLTKINYAENNSN